MRKTTKQETIGLTRRDFLRKTSAATAIVGAAAGGLVFGAQEAGATPLPKNWDGEYDVIIIGSGFAGLAAAIEAKKAGASVAILEKMRVAGGNSIINGGVVAAAGNPLQQKEGIKDSPELLYQDMLKAGLGLNHPELARMVAEKSNEMVQWTINELGVKYKNRLAQFGGHSVPRSYTTHNQSGSGIIRPMLTKLKALGLKVRTKAFLNSLVLDADGRVKGVEILEGYVSTKPDSGTKKFIKARKAVVLATGGFSNDIIFRITQDPRLGKDSESTNQPGATAEALVEAPRIGAMPVQLSWIQLGPWASPDEKGFGVAPIFAAYSAFPYGVMVDPGTGKRFVNELADRKVRADAILKVGKACIGIADQQGTNHSAHFIDKCLKRNVVKKFDTLEALAAAYRIPLQGLKNTIEKYNGYVEKGMDDELEKPFRKDAKPIAQAPFYAVRLWPKVHHTMGGIQINTKAQALGLNHRPIKGLYVAGEVSGGVHGACRLGTCAIADCLVFGRIAGKNAAAENPWT